MSRRLSTPSCGGRILAMEQVRGPEFGRCAVLNSLRCMRHSVGFDGDGGHHEIQSGIAGLAQLHASLAPPYTHLAASLAHPSGAQETLRTGCH